MQQCIIKSRWIMFALTLVIFICMTPFALQYQKSTSLIFAAPKGSRSYRGQQFVNATFPNLTHTEQFAVMVDDVNGEYHFDKRRSFCEQNFSASLQMFVQDVTTKIEQVVQNNLISTANFFKARREYPLAQDQFCTKSSMLMQFAFAEGWVNKGEVQKIKSIISGSYTQYLKDIQNVRVDGVSMASLLQEVVDGTMSDIFVLDGISVVFGFVIVSVFIRRLQLLLISITNLVVSIGVSFGVSYFFAQVTDVPCFAAAIQSAITVALTFIYSLFLFDSIKKDMMKGSDAKHTIEQMLEALVHVVIVSGCCLGLVFLLMVICPVPMIQNIGITGFICVIVVQIVSIVNTTALIAIFPKFFLGETYNFWAMDYLNCNRKQPDLDKIDVYPNYDQQEHDPGNSCSKFFSIQRKCEGAPSKMQIKLRNSFSWLISKKLISFLSIGAVVLIPAIFAYPAFKIQKSIDLNQMVPRGSQTMKAIQRFGDVFGSGLIQPFIVVFHKEGHDSLINSEAFHLMGSMASKLIKQSKIRFTGNQSYMQLKDSQVIAPFHLMVPLSVLEFKILNMTNAFQFMLNQTAPYPKNLSTFAMLIQANIPITGKGSDHFALFFREIFDEFQPKFKQLGIDIGEYSIQTAMVDAVDMLFRSIPVVLSVIVVVIAIILAIAFKSLIAPLRLIFEIVIITVFYMGINVLIYQYGHANGDDALFWASIFLILSISIGLACVHDIFAFQGIYREFWKNYKTAKSNGMQPNFINCIYAASDNLILVMTAGLIMIVSFSGLLFSSIDALLQFGTCLMVDLTFDTLFVVPILVPALTYLIGEPMMFPGNWLAKRKDLKYNRIEEKNKIVHEGADPIGEV